ncbi:Ig-like domain-containing protein [Halobacterium litoreum]|uniref:Ig-like domain-containing protein n=1 Tax=Halobacterium litoreum TaxID=2039234 RepID=A0ABD5NCZ3_9EURY|nr:Ig-like domain-containing protein [Halobacterium litoreum]UHH14068.1 Ig-like domain-containing protein [Halobacterium litoreum]
MRFRDDTRGVTVQVGAVLLFATIIIALALYQATVVPTQNADVEYKHSQAVEGDLTQLRNSLLSTAAAGSTRPTSVRLGTTYPSRVFLVNPPPPSGTLRTGSYDNDTIQVSNVEATNPETQEFLDGTWSASTKYVEYVPDYSEYQSAPTRRYTASVLSNYFPDRNVSVPLTDQLLVRGDTITLVSINGSLATSRSGPVTVSPEALSAPHQRVQVEPQNPGSPVTVTVPTSVSAAAFRNQTALGDQPNVSVVDAGENRVEIQLTGRDTYTLQTARVGVGSDTADPGPHYLTVVENDSDSVTVEARDRFNNPVAGVTVSVPGASPFQTSNRVTDENGQATFRASDSESGTATLQILGGGPDRTEVEASVDTTTATVGNGSGGGSLVYTGNATAFDGADPDSVPGGLNVTVENQYGSNVTITDVTVIPENADITGLSDKATGEGPGQSELAVDSLADQQSATADVLILDDQYVYVGDRGLTLSAETSRTERVYDTSAGVFTDVSTTVGGSPVELAPDDSAEITFSEFYAVTGGGATAVNVSNEDFRVVVSYRHDDGTESSEFVAYARPPSADDGGGGGGGSTPQVAFRLDDLTHQDQSSVEYVGSYSVSNTNSSFERVEIEYANQNDGSATQTLQNAGVRGGLRYSSSYGAGATYDVTVRVIYSDSGGEYVAASETVSDVADAANPAGNDDLSTGTTAVLSSSTIDDKSSNGQGPRYWFDYTVSSGDYAETELVAVSTGTGDKASTTSATRSTSKVKLSPGYGYGEPFKIAILVYGPDGAVVDSRIVSDTADGTDP